MFTIKKVVYICKVNKAQNNLKTRIMKKVNEMTAQEVKQEMNFLISKKNGFTQNDYIHLTALHNRQVDLMNEKIINDIINNK